jgi:hypothetical protein
LTQVVDFIGQVTEFTQDSGAANGARRIFSESAMVLPFAACKGSEQTAAS